MRAGELDRFLTIQQATDVKVLGSGNTVTWADLHVNVHCRVLTKPAGEKFEQDRETSRTTKEFKIRWRSGLNEKMRVVFDGNNYDIVDIMELGRREAQVIKAFKKY